MSDDLTKPPSAELPALVAKAHEMSHRRVIWTRDADRFVAEAQPILSALADALERMRVSSGTT